LALEITHTSFSKSEGLFRITTLKREEPIIKKGSLHPRFAQTIGSVPPIHWISQDRDGIYDLCYVSRPGGSLLVYCS
jgi:hypothetical protein